MIIKNVNNSKISTVSLSLRSTNKDNSWKRASGGVMVHKQNKYFGTICLKHFFQTVFTWNTNKFV